MIGGRVYFVKGGNFIKIGWSKSVYKRLEQIATHCPFPIELLVAIKAKKTMELQFHSRFSHLRVNREWFQFCDELENEVNSLLPKESNGLSGKQIRRFLKENRITLPVFADFVGVSFRDAEDWFCGEPIPQDAQDELRGKLNLEAAK